MLQLMNSVQRFEKNFDKKAEKFACRHPYLSFAVMFVGMPVFVLTAVCLGSVAVMVPLSWMMGWI